MAKRGRPPGTRQRLAVTWEPPSELVRIAKERTENIERLILSGHHSGDRLDMLRLSSYLQGMDDTAKALMTPRWREHEDGSGI